MQTKECWSTPGHQATGTNHAKRHRARHRHVGDIRFAIAMVFVFALACGLAFRSDAAPERPPLSAHAHTGGLHPTPAAQG